MSQMDEHNSTHALLSAQMKNLNVCADVCGSIRFVLTVLCPDKDVVPVVPVSCIFSVMV